MSEESELARALRGVGIEKDGAYVSELQCEGGGYSDGESKV